MPPQELDPTGAKILDGAVRVLGDFGFKRATVELVAKYAGVSHMTIYRRWPSKNDLLHAAVIGEFTRLLDTAFDGARESGAPFAEATLGAFTDIVWAVQSHPLVLRELDADTGEPALSGASSTLMETSVPLVSERLRVLAGVGDAPADLDSLADVFVRLAHSLVTVRRPDQPLSSRAEVDEYARECFGPYVQNVAREVPGPAAPPDSESAVIDLDQRRSFRDRTHRPHLQIAAASLVAVLTLGAGLTAVLNGNIKVPFIAPANISRSDAPVSPEPPAGVPTPPQDAPRPAAGTGATSEAQPSVPSDQPPVSAANPTAAVQTAAPGVTIPVPARIGPGAGGGSIGGGPAAESPVTNQLPAAAPAPTPQPTPAPKPPAPPAPKPPPPGPPAPKPPAPNPPAPKPPAPKPPGPGPGPGPGPQANKQPGPAN